MTIFIRISPVVMVIAVVALIAGHMGGISVAIGAVGIGVGIAVPVAVVGGLVLLGLRLRRENPSREGLVRMTLPPVIPGRLGPPPRAIEPVRLADDQLDELADKILRRSQRREQ